MDVSLIFFRVSRYLRYIAFSKNRKGHGIHSPFVFDHVSRVFLNKADPVMISSIENVRRRLKSDKRMIEVMDLGAGSAGRNRKLRKVSDIVRLSAVPKKFGILLSNMAREFGSPGIIEFGTSFGISTMYLASGCSNSEIFTIEGSPAVAGIASDNFIEAGLTSIRVLTGSFEERLPEILNTGIKPGLVFIDGNHRKTPLLEYFEQIAKVSDHQTVVIIDDINYSSEMNEAWCVIKEHDKVSVTIDIFRMGIVFFRKGTGRHNHMIRY
jgi:predicted O-methyltransferase YrrM